LVLTRFWVRIKIMELHYTPFIYVKIVLFFTPQAPFKRLHFRSRRQKSFSFAFSLTHAHLKLSLIQKVKIWTISLHQNLTFSILLNRAVSLFLLLRLRSSLLGFVLLNLLLKFRSNKSTFETSSRSGHTQFHFTSPRFCIILIKVLIIL
jgi:hypothetical protein